MLMTRQEGMMLKGLSRIGLAVGTDKISLIWLIKRRAKFRVHKAGTLDIPTDIFSSGVDSSYLILGEAIKKLVDQLGLRGKEVASAISGPQIYVRSIVVPKLKLKEMKGAAYYKASLFLPIPVDDVVMDVFPLRYFQENGSTWCELFFVAVPKQSVEVLRQACEYAGLKVRIIEIESLALIRALGNQAKGVTAIVQFIGRNINLNIFINGVPIFSRTLYTSDSSENPSTMPRIVREIKMAIEYFNLQSPRGAQEIRKITLCGTTDLASLKNALEQQLSEEIQILDFADQLSFDSTLSKQLLYELVADYPVAFGLAVRRRLI